MTYRPWFSREGVQPRVGIELEMNGVTVTGTPLNCAKLARALNGAGLQYPVNNSNGYTHSNGANWDVKTDGSCGLEVATPAVTLDEEGNSAELKAGIEAVAALRPQVNRACGLHVWLEVRDFDWQDMKRLLALWARYEAAYFSMLPKSRRADPSGNSHDGRTIYCRAMRKVEWDGAESMYWGGYKRAIEANSERAFRTAAQGVATKYQALNISQWWRTGRIEFRLHSGTVDYEKVRNWVKVLLALAARVKASHLPKVACTTSFPFDAFNGVSTRAWMKALGVVASRGNEVPESNEELVQWVHARRVQFRSQNARI